MTLWGWQYTIFLKTAFIDKMFWSTGDGRCLPDPSMEKGVIQLMIFSYHRNNRSVMSDTFLFVCFLCVNLFWFFCATL